MFTWTDEMCTQSPRHTQNKQHSSWEGEGDYRRLIIISFYGRTLQMCFPDIDRATDCLISDALSSAVKNWIIVDSPSMHCLYPSTTLDFSVSYNTHKQRHYNSRWMLLKQQVVKALSTKNKKGRGGVGGDERLVSFVFHCSPFHSVSCPLCHSRTRTFISACTEASSQFSAHCAVKCWLWTSLWISYVFAKPLMRKMLFLLCSFILPSEG